MATKKAKKNAAPAAPEFPSVIETFRYPGKWEREQCHSKTPSVFNSTVSVRRYRITFEEIPESVDIIRDRITKLWRESGNSHHREPLKQAAEEVGMSLDHLTFGKDRARVP